MKKSILLLVACAGIAVWFFYVKPQQAMVRVMKIDQALARQRDNLPRGSSPTQVARGIEQYCVELEGTDMSDCPADFRVAYTQHIRAWREAEAAIAQVPDSFWDGVLLGAFNSLVRGEADGGAGRLQQNIKEAATRIRETWEQVERTAANYGAAVNERRIPSGDVREALLPGTWRATVVEDGRTIEIVWTIRADGTEMLTFTSGEKYGEVSGSWKCADGILVERTSDGTLAKGSIRWIDDNSLVLTIIDNGNPRLAGAERHYIRR